MVDKDADGVDHKTDNCFQPNADQKDSDGDKIGDECDLTANGPVTGTTGTTSTTPPPTSSTTEEMVDKDADGVDDKTDNCFQPNADQKDSDGDKIGDECDLTANGPVTGPLNTTPPGAGTTGTTPSSTTNPALTSTQDQSIDSDLDGIVDDQDNCPTLSNTDQTDSDADGLGDVCDNKDNTVTEPMQPLSTEQSEQTENTQTKGEQGGEESGNEDGSEGDGSSGDSGNGDGGDSSEDSSSGDGGEGDQ
jgi:hypothetical protein